MQGIDSGRSTNCIKRPSAVLARSGRQSKKRGHLILQGTDDVRAAVSVRRLLRTAMRLQQTLRRLRIVKRGSPIALPKMGIADTYQRHAE